MRAVHPLVIKLAEYVNTYFPVKQPMLSQINLPLNIVFAKDLLSCSCNRVRCIDDQKSIKKTIIFVIAYTPRKLASNTTKTHRDENQFA